MSTATETTAAKSWGHTLAPCPCPPRCWCSPGGMQARCSARGCTSFPCYAASYRYVTGRAGRVSHQTRYLCTDHARRFAETHGLELPPPPPPTSAASFSDADDDGHADRSGHVEEMRGISPDTRPTF